MSRVIRMAIQYEGTRFHGFGPQPGLLTVQSVLEQSLADVLGHSVRVTAAGRTDAGVHAEGQVVSFPTTASLPGEAISRAVRSRLPDDILAGDSQEAASDFDARRSARRRHYRYSVWNERRPSLRWRRFSLHEPTSLDQAAMNEAAALLLGQHDFSSFIGRASEQAPSSPIRTLQRAEWTREGELLHFDCSADAFARHMVRNLVGTLLLIGRGALGGSQATGILAARDRRSAGPTAPAHGLTLMQVDYGDNDDAAVRPGWPASRSCHDEEGHT